MKRLTISLIVVAVTVAAFGAVSMRMAVVLAAKPAISVPPLQGEAFAGVNPILAAGATGLPAGVLPAEREMAMRWPGNSPLFKQVGANLDAEFACLAMNVYWEARSEPLLGQFGVAAVTLNRVADPAFPDTICDVIRQGGAETLHRCQFSWWCDGKQDTPDELAAWERARSVAYTVLFFNPPDPTGGSLFYHADYVSPGWAKRMARITRIGRHIYYRQS